MTGRLKDRFDWPLVVTAEIQLWRRDGTKTRGPNGHAVVTALDEPSETYPKGVVHYRVMDKLLEGAVPADQVQVKKRSERTLRDALRMTGIKPSKRNTRTPKKKLKES